MAVSMDRYRGEMMPPGRMQVVDGHELGHYTVTGWRVVKVLEESELATCSEQVPLPSGGGNYPVTLTGTRGFTIQKSRFLIFLDEHSALKEAHASREMALAELKETAQRLSEMDKAQKATDAKALKLEMENKRLETENARIAGQSADNRRLKEKMETDIGKIRAAVGDLRMKEILG